MLPNNLLEYLDRSAECSPEKEAFLDERESYSFARLRDAAQSLGTALIRLTAARVNAPVAVLAERSAGTLAAMLGVLCAGCYYVPIDAQMPKQRQVAILATLHPAALVYPAEAAETAQALACGCPLLEAETGFATPADPALLAQQRRQVLDVDPAYVIFTSGSTGTPKGIVVSHRSVIDFTEWMAEAGQFSASDIMGNQAPFYFDLSVKDIYQTLRNSASCYIIPKKLFLFPLLLVQFLEEKKITALLWATSAFHLVASSGALEKCAPSHLRTAMLGGEALQARLLNRWRAVLPNVRYVNLYGPTEVTVDCTWYPIERDFADDERIPIGYACANKEVFLLDGDLRPVPAGESGEICVRGSGLACGYFGDWDKTGAAFIQDPRNPAYPSRIYRTGDLGRFNERGELEFLSRQDGQIKHMGYRIELGEIETALYSIPSVEEAVCLFSQMRDRILCIYSGTEDKQALARAAREKLPRYMLPNIYYQLESLPHNANGKIDRPALRRRYLPEEC